MTEGQSFPLGVTDINGRFEINLAPGNHVLTLREFGGFPLFLKIVDGGLNPDNFELAVDPSWICCFLSPGVAFPKPIVLPNPPYPPAARAIHATGTVVVVVTIDTNGNVTAAKTQSGHLLLKQTAERAAKLARFEPSVDVERSARLTYIFLIDDEPWAKYIIRYSDLYRTETIHEPETGF